MTSTLHLRESSRRWLFCLLLGTSLLADGCGSSPSSPSQSGTTTKVSGVFAISNVVLTGSVEIFNGGPYRRWYEGTARITESSKVGAPPGSSGVWTLYDENMRTRTFSNGACSALSPGSYTECTVSNNISYSDSGFGQARTFNFTVTFTDYNGYSHTLTSAGSVAWK